MRGIVDDPFRELMQFQIERARKLYAKSAALADHLSTDGQRIFRIMHASYAALLEAIARRNGDVFTSRVRLGLMQRLRIVAGLW